MKLKLFLLGAVVLPFAAILILRFLIAPQLWPHEAARLGSVLGYIFLWYLLGVVTIVIIWRIRSDRRGRSEESAGQQQPTEPQ